ncbi:inorganic phosphate transporter [Sulfurovum sp. NBC37-1]|uniref:inorganic phosphate transporter n=1 Tax=Sulfurovum sp. (strain NBC37-1) TaxID=387093 RepID=UPI000158792B|nr:inorganic phosphate transporter [Sulfurovum sp. NBC37-1]BAF73214.1 inorganic phosphate transporter, PiT family [Sulfurovum sp. NBC37-1]
MNNTIKLLLGAAFAAVVAFYASSIMGHGAHAGFMVLAAVFGAYMAMNIGANDVANNVGPAFGSGAITMGGVIVIAAIFEATGALVAGGDVVGTIKKGIIDPAAFGNDPMLFVYAMSAALLAAALWLNLATWLKAPVSTTHSIVGGVVGAGIAAGGFAIVSWGTMGKIAASWVISPVLGGVIAAIFLYVIKSQILYQKDMRSAAKKVVPILVAIMAAAFLTYLTLKGLKHVWKDLTHVISFLPQTKKPTFGIAVIIGLIGGFITYVMVKPRILKKVENGLGENRADINILFGIPLVFSAIFLSFAHGANDVANAVGPLAAVYDALTHAAIATKAAIPLWVMVVGGVGISIGLALYGPRLIRTVGSEITELDEMRAFSIMMAAAITVIIASQLGLPVSSTHIAVGAVFGVGFLREWLDSKNMDEKQQKLQVEVEKLDQIKAELNALKSEEDYKKQVELIDAQKRQKKKVKSIKRSLRENYVKRGMVKKIIAAWIITVPAAAFLSAIIFFMIKGFAA